MRRVLVAAVVAGLVAVTACARDAGPSSWPASSGAATFTNPVVRGNFPDPGVIRADGTWYAFGTNDGSANVPMIASVDLVTWARGGDVLPQLGRWASPGRTWAPEVVPAPDGNYLLYYTARSSATGRQCIGVAIGSMPRGPFADAADVPLVCQADQGGSIDASPYVDQAQGRWLYWKNDGNAVGLPTHVYGQRLSGDGRQLTGAPVPLIGDDAPWEGAVVEAPQLVRHAGRLYLFYSANAFDTDAYAVGYAACDTPLGPCRDAPENPVLASSAAAAGPGHSFLVTEPGGGTWLLYHAWPPDAVGSVQPGRQLWLDRVDWVDGRPVVRGPTAGAQPAPPAPPLRPS